MRTRPLQLAPIALLLLTSTSIAGPTDLTCWLTNSSPPAGQAPIRRWSDTTKQIDVYVDSSPSTGVQTVHYNPIFVAKATEIAVERWNEQGGIPQRLVFAGFKTESAQQLPGSVVVISGDPNSCSADTFGSASAGCTLGSTGFCTSGAVTLWRRPVSICSSTYFWGDDYSDPNKQGDFVNIMVHELGHTLGRSDAYRTDCGIKNQTSVMETSDVQRRDLTDFDRSEMQAVYGSRAATNILMRRMLSSTTTAWGPVVNSGLGNFDIAPGPGSSQGFTSVPVTTTQFVGAATQIVIELFSGTQNWGAPLTLSGQFRAKKPVSTSLASTGEGVMAYMAEDGGNDSTRRLCIRRRTSGTNGTWGAETCSNPCNGAIPNNGVSTAYDPISGRFFVTHQCENDPQTSKVRVAALATATCAPGVFRCAEVSQLLDIGAAETPVVACGPTAYPGPYSSCRLVYAQRNLVGQKIAWRTLGFLPDSFGLNNELIIGSENQTQIESEHAPAVTYYGDAFQMALSYHGTSILTYYLFPTASQWVNDATLNTTGWVSPPFYSPTQTCMVKRGVTVCNDQLHVFWLQYR